MRPRVVIRDSSDGLWAAAPYLPFGRAERGRLAVGSVRAFGASRGVVPLCERKPWVGRVGRERVLLAARAAGRQAMAKATVEVLVDDLDGSDAVETVRLGRNGESSICRGAT